mgnify:CR=1 FL=1
MAHTGHGHHIPNSPLGTIADHPKNPARCGGVNICPRCKMDVEEYNSITVGEDTDFQERAKQMVKDYVDSLHKQNFPMTELPTYTVYVVWFAKTLQNWKAVLGTTMSDGKLFELTHNGDDKVTYFDAYVKTDNFPIHDRA